MEFGGSLRQFGAELLYIVLLGVFFAIIWFGYNTTIATAYPQINPGIVAAGATICVFIVYLCVRHTGHAWSNWREASATGRFAIVGWFFPLFFFSALGVITSAMLIWEGPVICRDLLKESNQAFSKLEASAQTLLRVPAIEDIESKTATLEKSLSEEILNAEGGNFCGIGQKARATLAEIALLLPTFRAPLAPAKPQHDCRRTDELHALIAQYDGLIDDALENLPLRTQTRQREKGALNQQLQAASDEQIANLQRAGGNLAGVGTFAFNLNKYRDTVETLEKAAQVYVNYYQKLAGIVGANNIQAPASIDISSAETIATATQVLGSLYARVDRATTWIYILGALACDLIAAFVAFRIITNVRRFDLYRLDYAFDRKVDGTDVNYIWKPRRPSGQVLEGDHS